MILFLTGMPGCGKSSVAEKLADLYRRDGCDNVTLLEMSQVVTTWLSLEAGKFAPKDLLATPLGSQQLHAFLWQRLNPQPDTSAIKIVSGVREAHLLTAPLDSAYEKTVAWKLQCGASTRERRYNSRAYNALSFIESEVRAFEMGLPAMLSALSFVVDTETITAEEAAAFIASKYPWRKV